VAQKAASKGEAGERTVLQGERPGVPTEISFQPHTILSLTQLNDFLDQPCCAVCQPSGRSTQLRLCCSLCSARLSGNRQNTLAELTVYDGAPHFSRRGSPCLAWCRATSALSLAAYRDQTPRRAPSLFQAADRIVAHNENRPGHQSSKEFLTCKPRRMGRETGSGNRLHPTVARQRPVGYGIN